MPHERQHTQTRARVRNARTFRRMLMRARDECDTRSRDTHKYEILSSGTAVWLLARFSLAAGIAEPFYRSTCLLFVRMFLGGAIDVVALAVTVIEAKVYSKEREGDTADAKTVRGIVSFFILW